MALFNRKKSQTISELEDYYANRNNSTGRAWLMALLSLLITVAVLTALFFGGRWIYRTLTNDDVKVVTTSNGTASNSDTIIETTTPSTTTPASEPNGVVSDEAATTTSSTAHTGTHSSTNNTASTTPKTGDSEALPNTGAGNILGLFLAVTALGYIVSIKKFLLK
jgi:hypothetical protein